MRDMTETDPKRDTGSPAEVFGAFLKLGLTSFGGPVAHLGYFRTEFVVRRQWIDDAGYADLVALSQFLPGPSSSKVGFALGLMRAGPLGALAAWLAFTLPSALALFLFALGAAAFGGPLGAGLLTGLKIVAVAIVAQAVWGMARSLCPDRPRATIAVLAALLVLLLGGSAGQVAAILAGAVAGLVFCKAPVRFACGRAAFPVSRGFGVAMLGLFAALLLGLPLLAAVTGWQGLAVFGAFFRAGALVFGGGHVVLPLLEAGVVQPGWISHEQFLAGYGAAQAIPGPLFSVAAYLGALLEPGPNGLAGATLALTAIFLPGFLLLLGVIPFWDSFRAQPAAQALIRGANAAVVGILGAALYHPLFTSAITGPAAFALALGCFGLLTVWNTPPWIVVLAAALCGALGAALTVLPA